MRKWLLPALWVAVCFILVGCSGVGRSALSWQTASIAGTVYDAESEQPLSGVAIKLGDYVAHSDEAGQWVITAVDRGVHLLEVAATTTHRQYQEWVSVDKPSIEVAVALEPTSDSAPSPDDGWEAKADLVIATGLEYLGTPYRWGGKWEVDGTFDCSNFVAHVFREALGMVITTSSRGQALLGEPVALADIRKGDLFFFWTPSRGPNEVGHVAIYMGDDSLLHTYSVGIGVTITGFSGTWWEDHYLFARRLL